VAVEKLAHSEFAKIGSRQEALQTISPSLLDIFYHQIFDFFQKNGLFQQPQGLSPAISERYISQTVKQPGAGFCGRRGLKAKPRKANGKPARKDFGLPLVFL
jgi:hypothetical protein